MKYAIQASYYMWNEETEQEYTQWLYIGTESKFKLFLFEEEINENTKLFDTAAEAGKYLDKYFSPDECRISFKNVRIVEVTGK